LISPRTLLALFLCLTLAVEAQTPHKSAAEPASKPVRDAQLYRNFTFAFRYQIPYGWVDRTKEMNSHEMNVQPKTATGDASATANSNPRNNESEQPSTAAAGPTSEGTPSPQGQVLLAIFERPPNAPGDTVNSTVLIVTESAAANPGLKKAEDYLGPLTELTTAKGFKAEGDPGVIQIDSRQLIRADFSKPITDKLSMHQSTLVMLAKDQILSFTFIAGTEDEIDDLIEALHFGPTKLR